GEGRERARPGDHVLDGLAGEVFGAAGGDLDDPVAAGLGEPLQRGVQRLARRHVDRRVGEAVLLGAVEHLRVDLWRRDRHDGRLPVLWVQSVSATAPISGRAGLGCALGVAAGAWGGASYAVPVLG